MSLSLACGLKRAPTLCILRNAAESVFQQRRTAVTKKVTGSSVTGLGSKVGAVKSGPMVQKAKIPAERDPVKLQTYCYGTNFMEDSEPVALKPDSEYPDWLWTLRLEDHPPLEEIEPGTKYYWERVKALNMDRQRLLRNKKLFTAIAPYKYTHPKLRKVWKNEKIYR
ncbi:unnamed protein product [Cyprideis torosa]|uniref:Large ribosomal subunit protein mL54 n=1 Tax=Cyprideis torosa TaxID=163714 RepID=A0A7R8ZLM9_9CRUS|nr:unnamed protein product [Cyprideis torosa]CAG0893613.1 unnamed protein product [Cyprideis torosa]